MSNEVDVARAIELLDAGKRESDVRYELGVTTWGLRLALRDAGYRSPVDVKRGAGRCNRHPIDEAELRAMAKTATLAQMAKHFQCAEGTVSRRLGMLGIERKRVFVVVEKDAAE